MEKSAIIDIVKKDFAKRFRVIDNTTSAKKAVGGIFPDIILMRPIPPENDDILFIMRIESGKNMIDSAVEWRAMSNSPAGAYVIVPEAYISEAKKIANAAGIRIRFASLIVKGKEPKIRYE